MEEVECGIGGLVGSTDDVVVDVVGLDVLGSGGCRCTWREDDLFNLNSELLKHYGSW